jgi:hypothetical protein
MVNFPDDDWAMRTFGGKRRYVNMHSNINEQGATIDRISTNDRIYWIL